MIKAIGLTKTYHLDSTLVPALKGVDVEVKTGEFVAVSGPSGSGKSTLLSLMGCLELPTAGQVLFEGKDVAQLTVNQRAHLRARQIGFVFQTFNLLPVLTAYENVEYPLTLQAMSPDLRRRRVMDLLKDVGLEAYAQHRPRQLSGGQRQRVAIARALAGSPTLILADEPTANLDQVTGLEIIRLMKTLNEHTGVTLVFSSHDPKILSQAQRVVQLSAGQVVA